MKNVGDLQIFLRKVVTDAARTTFKDNNISFKIGATLEMDNFKKLDSKKFHKI